jgi:Rad3-related DNA helicase
LEDLKQYGDKFKYNSIKQLYKEIIDIVNNYETSSVFNFDDYKNVVDKISSLNSLIGRVVETLDEKIKATNDEKLLEHLLKISNVFRSIGKANSIVSSGARYFVVCETEKDKVVLKPVFPNDVVDQFIYDKGEIYLHMSATICGYKEYIEQMNIDPNDCVYINVDNPIPLENRKVFYCPTIKMSGKMDDEKVTATANFIDDIIDNYHSGDNGIVHTVSFSLAEAIKEKSRYSDRMYVLAGKERDKILNLLKQKEKGYIILSPSVEEGFDFKNDMARWQVIAKVPYGFMGDAVIKLINEYFPNVYFRNAVLRIVQAAGRSTRGVNDYSNVYITDSSFESLFNNNRQLFPEYFIESVVKVEKD